ncbi:MAG: GNAT family N-acetyltransferase [Chloroflexota bacterium]
MNANSSTNLFEGKLVRLTAGDPGTLAEAFSRWARNSTYARLLDSDPSRLWSQKKTKEWFEKDLEKEATEPGFCIRTVADDKLIGFVSAWGLNWQHGDTFLGIGIGEEDFWGKGYGTEALRLFLGYVFREMNLRRVSLNVFGYNPRAIRSYEKCGFKIEGRLREAILKEGKRWDVVFMGILREEWEQLRSTGTF